MFCTVSNIKTILEATGYQFDHAWLTEVFAQEREFIVRIPTRTVSNMIEQFLWQILRRVEKPCVNVCQASCITINKLRAHYKPPAYWTWRRCSHCVTVMVSNTIAPNCTWVWLSKVYMAEN